MEIVGRQPNGVSAKMSLLLCCYVLQADQDWSIEDLIQAAESTHYANLAVADVEAAFLEGRPSSQQPGSPLRTGWMLSPMHPSNRQHMSTFLSAT